MAVTGATPSRRRLALPDRDLSEHDAAAEGGRPVGAARGLISGLCDRCEDEATETNKRKK